MFSKIVLEESTKRKLEMLKKRKKFSTFDELIENWIDQELELPKSIKGKYKFLDYKNARDKLH